MKNIFTFVILAGLLGGCASLLPREHEKSKVQWQNFDAAQNAYNEITVGQTKASELNELGFSPNTVPNVEILNYVEIINRMSSIFNKSNLPDGIKQCLAAGEDCTGYLMHLKDIKRDRIGNVLVDLLGFRKETKITGWRLGTTIILVDNTVVYKSWVGTPNIEEYEKRIIPLGPIQNIGDFLVPR